MNSTYSSVRQVVYVKGKIPLLQNVRLEVEYQLYMYRPTSSAHIEHLDVVK